VFGEARAQNPSAFSDVGGDFVLTPESAGIAALAAVAMGDAI
jgi:hypothetical protein